MSRSLELLHVPPTTTRRAAPPLLFVHGAFTAAWCWHHFLPWFAAQGFDAWALSLSGHGGSGRDKPYDLLGISDYVRDLLEAAEQLPASPIVLGHSMGGFVTQKALEIRPFPAVVLLASVPPSGLAGSLWHLVIHAPGALMEMNRLIARQTGEGRAVARTLFHHLPSPQALRDILRRAQPESVRALWDMTLFGLPQRHRQHPTRWLVVGAEADQIIPPSLVETTARTYCVVAHLLPGAGHAFMLEPTWQQAAHALVALLEPVLIDTLAA